MLTLVTSALAATPFNGSHFFTNSYRHTQEVSYPLSRPGHVRSSGAKSVFDGCVSNAESPRGIGTCNQTAKYSRMHSKGVMQKKIKAHEACAAAGECPLNRPFSSAVPCVGGKSGVYDCKGIDMLSFVPISGLGSTMDASDIWGWTDSTTGDEIAIINVMDGTSFVQVTDPVNPIVLGFLPSTSDNHVIWADTKVSDPCQPCVSPFRLKLFCDDFASRRDLTMSSRYQSLANNKDRSSCSLVYGLQYHNPELRLTSSFPTPPPHPLKRSLQITPSSCVRQR